MLVAIFLLLMTRNALTLSSEVCVKILGVTLGSCVVQPQAVRAQVTPCESFPVGLGCCSGRRASGSIVLLAAGG